MAKWDRRQAPSTDVAPPSSIRVPDGLRLVVLSGPDRGRELVLPRGEHTVGKISECSLVLSDGQVSRRHLVIDISNERVVVRDLGSTNGSWFQGARFSEIEVGIDAVLTIGATVLQLTTAEADAGRGTVSDRSYFGRLIGHSRKMRQTFALLEQAALGPLPVLLEGETGTGKELAAEALHAQGSRADRPFVVCDLAGLSRSLIESELFGHVRGAFTGADRDHAGAFVRADGGTIFVDELGELGLAEQPRLLRAFERGQVKPVGAESYRTVDVRVIAATNRDLQKEVSAGRFREDLYHRLAGVRVRLPPLRERKEDIPHLVDHFLAGCPIEVPPETHALLAEYDWPGNVRELRNVIERARSSRTLEVLAPAMLGLDGAAAEIGVAPSAASYRDAKERLVAAWEREFVAQLLKRADGHVSRAARVGGIDRVHLYRLMRKHGISGAK